LVGVVLCCKRGPHRWRSVGNGSKQGLKSRNSRESLWRDPYPLEHQAFELAKADSTVIGDSVELDLTGGLGDVAQSSGDPIVDTNAANVFEQERLQHIEPGFDGSSFGHSTL